MIRRRPSSSATSAWTMARGCAPGLGLLTLMMIPLLASASENKEYVILLHAMGRSSRSMVPMERALQQAGYQVLNVDYSSRSDPIEKLSEDVVGQAVSECQSDGAVTIHFVAHSLGGILVRSYLARHGLTNAGRVVMLGPPNQGSEVVDKLRKFRLFKEITGPAGREMGTRANSTPNQIGPANFCLGVIAGSRSLNWMFSLMIPGRDDGAVSIERTKLAGMTDHLVVPVSHTFLPRNATAIRQTIHFLQSGRFEREAAARPDDERGPG